MQDITSDWIQFLARQGARFSASAPSEVTGFEGVAERGGERGDDPGSELIQLSDLGLIAASGAEAANFLHNQLTNDVLHLPEDQARLAGYCTPKGRLLATMLIWRSGDDILLQLPREILPAILKRLQMYLLRTKASLRDVSADTVLLGLTGPAAAAALAPDFPAAAALAPYAKCDSAAGSLMRLADANGVPCYLWQASPEAAIAAWPRLRETLTPAPAAAWRLAQIRAGIPQVVGATQELFVPQMLNYDVIEGINFRKGCYPGQEIVARSQYLGKQKRRMLAATLPGLEAPAPGTEVFSSADPGQPCGVIVNAAAAPDGRAECLVEIKTAALEQGTVHLDSAQGPALVFGALPYPLPEPA